MTIKALKDSRNQRTQRRHLFLLFLLLPITIEYHIPFIFNDVDFYFYFFFYLLKTGHDFQKSVNPDSHNNKKKNKEKSYY